LAAFIFAQFKTSSALVTQEDLVVCFHRCPMVETRLYFFERELEDFLSASNTAFFGIRVVTLGQPPYCPNHLLYSTDLIEAT